MFTICDIIYVAYANIIESFIDYRKMYSNFQIPIISSEIYFRAQYLRNMNETNLKSMLII